MKKNKNMLYLGSIIILGISVQLFFLFYFMDPGKLKWPDPNHYLSIAKNLANGNSYSSEIWNLYRSPGYPFFLYLLIKLVGYSIINIRLAFVGFNVLFLLGAYLLGREWKGGKFGLLLAFFSCLYPYYIYIPLTLYPESFLIFISPWVLYLLLRFDHSMNYYTLLVAGLVISWGVLTRPTYIVAPFSFFLYSVLIKRKLYIKLLIFLFLIVLPLIPVSLWGFHNYKMYGHFIISTAANINLFYGFNENTTIHTKSNCPVPEDIHNELFQANDIFEQDSIYKSSAIEFIQKNPLRSFYLASVRMFDLWNPIPHTTTNYSVSFKIISAIPYIVILLFSFIGFYVLKKDYFDYTLVSVLVLNTIANGIFAVSIRYRVVFDIILIMYFTYFIYYLLEKRLFEEIED